jgi:hypothetical protein
MLYFFDFEAVGPDLDPDDRILFFLGPLYRVCRALKASGIVMPINTTFSFYGFAFLCNILILPRYALKRFLLKKWGDDRVSKLFPQKSLEFTSLSIKKIYQYYS